MARSRRKPNDKIRGQAFTISETNAVEKALGTLYRRSLFHLVEPKFTPRPTMAEVFTSLIHQDAWDYMAKAQDMMVFPENTWTYFKFSSTYPVGATGCELDVRTTRLLPDINNLPAPWKTGAVVPEVYVQFARAAVEHREKWHTIINVFRLLNKSASRKTAAFHWPCVGALLQIGGAPRDDLSDVTRPGNIDGALSAKLRESNAFIMQHSMLPPIDSKITAAYEGDEDTGLAGRLVLPDIISIFNNVVWPTHD